MKYWVHPTRGVFHKGAVYFNPGMPYPMPDNEPPMAGSIETDINGTPIPPDGGIIDPPPTRSAAKQAEAPKQAEVPHAKK